MSEAQSAAAVLFFLTLKFQNCMSAELHVLIELGNGGITKKFFSI